MGSSREINPSRDNLKEMTGLLTECTRHSLYISDRGSRKGERNLTRRVSLGVRGNVGVSSSDSRIGIYVSIKTPSHSVSGELVSIFDV